jgi:ATP-binding cassette subfamily B protein
MLRRPRVLILDEPTSALDGEMERQIAASLSDNLRGGTLIVITHRPALAASADMIVTLDEGRARVTLHRHDVDTAIA